MADLGTGEVLAAQAPHRKLRPASTLKVLTALVALSRLDPAMPYVATAADASLEGSKVGIVNGGTYTVDQLMLGLLLSSGNDAAYALGQATGGQAATVGLMNEEAHRLGAYDTHAVNTSGLDADGQLTSAYDLALIARAALERDDFRRYVATQTAAFPGIGGATFQIANHNRLLDSYAGALGVKTGYTTLSKHTFIGAAERDGHRLVVTVLNSPTQAWQTAATLLDWGFASVGAGGDRGLARDTAEDVAAQEAALASPSPSEAAGGGDDDAPVAAARLGSLEQALDKLPRWAWWAGAAGAIFVMALLGLATGALSRRRRRGKYRSLA